MGKLDRFTPTSPLKRLVWTIGIVATAFMVRAPVYLLVKYSISDMESINTGGLPVPLWPYHPTFAVFSYLFTDPEFWQVVLNSLWIAIGTVLLSSLLGVPAAYVLARYKVPFRRAILIGIISVRLFPDISSVIPISVFFISLNLYSSFSGVILAHTLLALPYVIFIGMSAFEGIPRDIEEQAMTMGANQFQIFFRILLPIAIPGLAAAAIYTFLLSWDEFIFAHFLLDPGGKIQTLTLYLRSRITFQPPQNLLAAISVCLSLPVIIFSFAVQKYMISGMTAGSVK